MKSPTSVGILKLCDLKLILIFIISVYLLTFFLKLIFCEIYSIFFVVAKPVVLDLGFVFGTNGVKAVENFNTEKDLAKKIVEKYDVSKSATLVGAITYDDDAVLAWKIGDATEKRTTLDRINQLQRRGNGKNVLKALQIARSRLFSSENGARRNAPKTLVVFVDKVVESRQLDIVSKELEDNNINVIVITIGKEVLKTDVSGIARQPSNVINADDFDDKKGELASLASAKSVPGN